MADHSAEYVAVEVAGTLAGISPRTLRHWIAVGKLSAIAGKRGKLVSVEEVHVLAVLTGKAPGNATGPDDNPAISAAGNAGNATEGAQPQGGAVVVALSVSAQLAAVRDEWLQPLVDRIAELEHDRGRLEAELAHATERAEQAEREREELRRLADDLQARHDALRSAAISSGPPAAPAATSAAEHRGTITGTADAPGPLRRLWRALRGE